jgi:alpha-1,2-mannosyltransferase
MRRALSPRASGGAFLIISPSYPWYLLLLVPMIAMSGRWEWLALPLAFMAHSLQPTTAVAQWGELTALVIVVAGSLIRSGPGVFGRVLREARHPLS